MGADRQRRTVPNSVKFFDTPYRLAAGKKKGGEIPAFLRDAFCYLMTLCN